MSINRGADAGERTLGYMAVHRIYYDGNFWSRHVVDGLFFVVDAERNWVPLSKEF